MKFEIDGYKISYGDTLDTLNISTPDGKTVYMMAPEIWVRAMEKYMSTQPTQIFHDK